MSKLNVCVLFGGVSPEHAVSCSTAKNVIDNLEKEKYNVFPLGITKEGKWLLYTSGATENLTNGTWQNLAKPAHISPDSIIHGIVMDDKTIHIDVVYIALHGSNGEDGTVQGLLELADIPYSGPRILGSALCMNKDTARVMLKSAGVDSVKYISVLKEEMCNEAAVLDRVTNDFELPVFVKPSNCGSSVGAGRADTSKDVIPAIKHALEFDHTALIEEFIDAREFECAVIGNDELITSHVGEVFTDNTFYDYEAKYVAGMANIQIPAELTADETSAIQNLAKKAYSALDLKGLCRIDFFIDKKTGRVILNELNTLPGCTPSSAFPVLFEKTGIPFSEVLDKVIDYALELR